MRMGVMFHLNAGTVDAWNQHTFDIVREEGNFGYVVVELATDLLV